MHVQQLHKLHINDFYSIMCNDHTYIHQLVCLKYCRSGLNSFDMCNEYFACKFFCGGFWSEALCLIFLSFKSCRCIYCKRKETGTQEKNAQKIMSAIKFNGFSFIFNTIEYYL